MGVPDHHRHVSKERRREKRLIDQVARGIRGTGAFPPELLEVMELKGLGVPLARSKDELDGLDARFVEDYQILVLGESEARSWDAPSSKTIRLR